MTKVPERGNEPPAEAPGPEPPSAARVRSGLRTTVSVAAVYGGSILFLMVGELLLARTTNDSAFGEYSLIRQAVPFVCALGLLGYDQALTRESATRQGVVPRFDQRQGMRVLRAGLVSALVAVYLVASVGVSVTSSLSLVVAGMAVSATNIVSGGMRASSHHTRGAMAQQGYRLITGVALILLSLSAVGEFGVIALAAGAVALALWALLWNFAQPGRWAPADDEHRLMRRLGLGYSVSLLALSLGDWLDQALVAEFSKDLAQVGEYSQAKLLAFYPSLSLGSILGFVALPVIARRRQFLARPTVVRWMILAIVGSLLTGGVVAALAALLSEPLLGRSLDAGTIAALGAVGAVRLYYVLPSALLGAVASPSVLMRLGGWGIAGVGIQVAVTLSLMQATGILVAAALGLLTSGIVRSLAASVLSLRHSEDHKTSLPTALGAI